MLKDGPWSSIALLSSTSLTLCNDSRYQAGNSHKVPTHRPQICCSSSVCFDEIWASWWIDEPNDNLFYCQPLLWTEIHLVLEIFEFKQILYPLSHLLEVRLAIGLHWYIYLTSWSRDHQHLSLAFTCMMVWKKMLMDAKSSFVLEQDLSCFEHLVEFLSGYHAVLQSMFLWWNIQ